MTTPTFSLIFQNPSNGYTERHEGNYVFLHDAAQAFANQQGQQINACVDSKDGEFWPDSRFGDCGGFWPR